MVTSPNLYQVLFPGTHSHLSLFPPHPHPSLVRAERLKSKDPAHAVAETGTAELLRQAKGVTISVSERRLLSAVALGWS